MDVQKQIQSLIKGEVKSDSETLAAFSKDASLYKIKPQLVVFPKDSEDVQKLVKFVSDQKAAGENISLAARAAGTDMTGGPLSESIVVSFTKYFNHIKKIGKDYAVVEPGVYYRDFEKETLKQNLLLPSYPASRELCAIGGIVANNSGGELNLVYGKTERYVQEIKMVLRDGKEYSFKPLTLKQLEQKKSSSGVEGEIYRRMFDLIDQNYDKLLRAKPDVSKNSAGYYLWNVYDKQKGIFDLTKMIVGSQGTLGIMTEVNLKLVKPKTREHLLVIMLSDLHQLPGIVNHLLKFKPQSIESYDDHTFKVAMKILPDIVARLKGNAIKLFFSFIPELWMTITGGIPKLVMLAEFSSDSDADALERAKEAQESLKEYGMRTKLIESDAQAQKYWVIRRESFNMLRHHVHGMRTAPFIDDFVIKPDMLGEFLPKLYEILNKYKLLYTIAGHVGDGNFHIIPLMKLGDPNVESVLRKIADEVYALVFQYKGSITGEHNDGLVRGPYLERMYGPEIYKLFVETKNIFDPQGIFNPGKKINASLDYAMQHLDFKKDK
ncbi:MAG: FAD-binding oxidoreductase [Candidatus Doudnabacteria bacterium]|nr:FAD-binding oxidoreductase [Candidatus Doudnabacteria bacterium]